MPPSFRFTYPLLVTVVEEDATAFSPKDWAATLEEPGPALHFTKVPKAVPKALVLSAMNLQSFTAGRARGAAAVKVRRSMMVAATAENDFILAKDNREVAMACRGVALVLEKGCCRMFALAEEPFTHHHCLLRSESWMYMLRYILCL